MSTNRRGRLVEVTCECGTVFLARTADVKRGWAKSCSKSCAAIKREWELDSKGYRTGRNQADGEAPTFQNAHQFDNCEI